MLLKKLHLEIKRPITCIIGGSKISTKIKVIRNLIPKFENIVIVGGMANNILNYKGINIGNSISRVIVKIIEEIFLASKNNCKIIIPLDVAVGKKLEDKAKIKDLSKIQDDDMILDIGPKTINLIKSILIIAKLFYGMDQQVILKIQILQMEVKKLQKKLLKKKNNIYSVAGGGDTIALINKTKAFEKLNFVSTAGGAFLEYLEGKEIPGIRALN